MIERGLYYATSEFSKMIQSIGGTWNDTKHRPERDIRSCYYHIGRTSSQSIFFISDAIPITDKYIDGIYVGGDQKHYIIKNKKLITELERKLFRILALENSRNNHFRQHITDVKNFLLSELQADGSVG